ncbi:hypothetical protein RKD37_007869 [Streptomyces ambofaciens]
MHGLEDLVDGPGLPLRLEDLGGAIALGAQDGGLFVALGGEDLRLALALRSEDRGPLVPLGPHLLLHGVLDGLRRVDRLDLHPVHPQPPFPGGLVEHPAQLAVDGVARGEGLLQVHGSHDVAQGGDGELLDRLEEVRDLVEGRSWIRDLEVQHGVDLDDQVVLGDDRLGLEGDHLFAQVDHRIDAVDVRDDHAEPGFQRAVVAAEPFDVAGAGLRHDAHRPHHGENGEKRDNHTGDEERRGFHGHSRG